MKIKAVCEKCGAVVMESIDLTVEEVKDKWVGLIVSSVLCAPRCPKCNYSTYSDCNSAISLQIFEGDKKIEYEDLK